MTSSYKLTTKTVGKLTINPLDVTVTITGNNDAKTYSDSAKLGGTLALMMGALLGLLGLIASGRREEQE